MAYWDDKAYAAVFVPAAPNTKDSSQTANEAYPSQNRHERGVGSTRDEDADMNELLLSIDGSQNGNNSKTAKLSSTSSALQSPSDPSSQDIKRADTSRIPIEPPSKISVSDSIDSEPREIQSESNKVLSPSNLEPQVMSTDQTHAKGLSNRSML